MGLEATRLSVGRTETSLVSHNKPVLRGTTVLLTGGKEFPQMSQHNSRSLVLHAVQNCNTERMAKAVCGLASGEIVFESVRQSDTEVRGVVVNGNGKRYAVTLTAERAFCGCPD